MAFSILVVDDEKVIVNTVSAIFSAHGYAVETALSGEEAIAKVKTFCPDVLLSDIQLPGINGFQAALVIKESCPRCRLLFLSGYVVGGQLTNRLFSHSQEVLQQRGYGIELLPKPVPPGTLLQAVQRTLEPNEGSNPEDKLPR